MLGSLNHPHVGAIYSLEEADGVCALVLELTYADMGKADEAGTLHHELLARRTHQYVQPVMLAISASGVGDHEAAIGFCQQAVDERDAQFWLLRHIYPDLDRVRADPRFTQIVARFNLRR